MGRPMAEGEAELRIGIFVCECGGNIGDVVDVKAVCDEARKWENVVVAKNHRYLCSKPAQDMIVEAIKKFNLNRVVVASCTPRMHLVTFQEVLKRAGLNPYLLEFVNIREQCSWVHGPKKSEEATRKAVSLVRGGYERSFKLEPLEPYSEECSRDVLVIGGGIAGVTASLELGDMGYHVYLVERQPSIGGHMAKLTKVFPTLDCAQCILTPKLAEAGRHPNITLLTYAEVEDVKGRPGNYEVTVYLKPRGVDVEKCRACGACSKVCPVTCKNEFEEGRATRKAAYLMFPQAVPNAYVIDFEHCTKCGKCAEICPAGAINLEDEGKRITLRVGAIIAATGYEVFDPTPIEEYGYGVYPDVITMMELERLTSLFGPTGGYVKRFSDGGEVKKIAIVLCAGSRDRHRFVPYCSRICCMYSIKQAVLLKEQYGIQPWIFYTDIRAAGRGYEELYWRAQKEGVVFVRGKVSEVWRNAKTNRLVVRAEDTLTGRVIEEEFDMVALATAMVPPPGLDKLAEKLGIPLGEDGFIQEKHPKLGPVDSLRTGIYACGCALGPKDVRDTVSDALGAASRVAALLGKGIITTSPEKAYVKPELCDGCGVCVDVCPAAAITLSSKAKVNPFMCTGCGACVPVCPKEAIDFKNTTWEQLVAQMRGLMHGKAPDEVRLVAFVDNTIAYTGVDFLGLDRTNYPYEVRVVKLPSTAMLSLKHMLAAFALGADGIIVIEGEKHIGEEITSKRIEEILNQLDEMGIESFRVWYSLVELPAYKRIASIFREHTEAVKDLGPIPEETREKLRQELKL
ncbi:disulfide reductase [Candidatus Bathyarchaeota archaeon]|nr:MAG: disulfide reductase [Candidatus Bathyarchaeota archaeon]